MILKRLKVNTALEEPTNCYIVEDDESKETMVIDPGGEPEKIISMLDTIGIDKLKYIYLTHCHGDHFGGILELKKKKGGKVLIHRDDAEGLYNPSISLTYYIGMDDIELEADSRVDEGDKIHLGNLEFLVIHTPGHTKGGTSLYCKEEEMLFSGDTLFKGTWGRTDLPTSNFPDIINSITNKLVILPDDTIVYPGHGRPTKIKEEEPIYLNLRPRLD
ncbi:MAG: MBL fold metallo-hydrolase [Clostridiaceae bacterium]|nr:MBL fold metallo-hydrolase [Clostridiaceae bacterium]